MLNCSAHCCCTPATVEVYLAAIALARLGQLLDCAIADATILVSMAVFRMPICCMSICCTPICVMSIGSLSVQQPFAGCYRLLSVCCWISLCKYLECVQDWPIPRAPTTLTQDQHDHMQSACTNDAKAHIVLKARWCKCTHHLRRAVLLTRDCLPGCPQFLSLWELMSWI